MDFVDSYPKLLTIEGHKQFVTEPTMFNIQCQVLESYIGAFENVLICLMSNTYKITNLNNGALTYSS